MSRKTFYGVVYFCEDVICKLIWPVLGWIFIGGVVVIMAQGCENQAVFERHATLGNASTPQELVVRLEDYDRALAARGVAEEHRAPVRTLIGQLAATAQVSPDNPSYWRGFAEALIMRDRLPSIEKTPGVIEWPWEYSPVLTWSLFLSGGIIVASFFIIFLLESYFALAAFVRKKRAAPTAPSASRNSTSSDF